MNRACRIWLTLGLSLFSASCGSDELCGPPKLHLGLDQCAACGMIVSEERCSSSLLCIEEGGREYRVFDDVGCMLDYQTAHPQLLIVETFVHDYDSKQWLAAHSAVFLTDDTSGLRTPMGSGIVAFEHREKANSYLSTGKPSFATLDQLAEIRLTWIRKHRQSPSGN